MPSARLVTTLDGGDAQAAVAGDDDLGHGRHPDEVGAERLERADLGRRLEARPGGGEVDAFVQRRAERGGVLLQALAQRQVVGLREVREARAERVVVGPGQRVEAEHVDVVGIATTLPGGVSARSEPAALVRISASAPSSLSARIGVGRCAVGPLVDVVAAAHHGDRHAAARRARACRRGRRPSPRGSPAARRRAARRGRRGASASSPRPEPSTIARRARCRRSAADRLGGCVGAHARFSGPKESGSSSGHSSSCGGRARGRPGRSTCRARRTRAGAGGGPGAGCAQLLARRHDNDLDNRARRHQPPITPSANTLRALTLGVGSIPDVGAVAAAPVGRAHRGADREVRVRARRRAPAASRASASSSGSALAAVLRRAAAARSRPRRSPSRSAPSRDPERPRAASGDLLVLARQVRAAARRPPRARRSGPSPSTSSRWIRTVSHSSRRRRLLDHRRDARARPPARRAARRRPATGTSR